jgi:hypothetical protein
MTVTLWGLIFRRKAKPNTGGTGLKRGLHKNKNHWLLAVLVKTNVPRIFQMGDKLAWAKKKNVPAGKQNGKTDGLSINWCSRIAQIFWASSGGDWKRKAR